LLGVLPAGAVAIGLGVAASRQPTDAEVRFLPTRLALLALVVGIGFVFDDPAAPLTDPLPVPLRGRRAIRAAIGLSALTVFSVPVFFLAAQGMDPVWVLPTPPSTVPVIQPEEDTLAADQPQPPPPFPIGRLALEALTMTGLALGGAAVVIRRGELEPGRMVTGMILVTYAVTFLIPEPHRPWANPGGAGWVKVASWWWSAALAFTFITIVLSWDARFSRGFWRARIGL
ncbi:MAG TPA: hypothetical protein VJR05_14920, partial [Acidimicrobiia bacterium]|nr:hypothetical protein [Acidimicrobiia bacterium]